MQFEGSLGKLTVSSVNNPRKMIDAVVTSRGEDDVSPALSLRGQAPRGGSCRTLTRSPSLPAGDEGEAGPGQAAPDARHHREGEQRVLRPAPPMGLLPSVPAPRRSPSLPQTYSLLLDVEDYERRYLLSLEGERPALMGERKQKICDMYDNLRGKAAGQER